MSIQKIVVANEFQFIDALRGGLKDEGDKESCWGVAGNGVYLRLEMCCGLEVTLEKERRTRQN